MTEISALPPVDVVSWTPRNMGTLVGHADVLVAGSIILRACPVMIGRDGRPWAALPSRAVINGESRHVRDETGRGIYAPTAQFSSRAIQDQFSAEVVASLRNRHGVDLHP